MKGDVFTQISTTAFVVTISCKITYSYLKHGHLSEMIKLQHSPQADATSPIFLSRRFSGQIKHIDHLRAADDLLDVRNDVCAVYLSVQNVPLEQNGKLIA